MIICNRVHLIALPTFAFEIKPLLSPVVQLLAVNSVGVSYFVKSIFLAPGSESCGGMEVVLCYYIFLFSGWDTAFTFYHYMLRGAEVLGILQQFLETAYLILDTTQQTP